MADGGWGSGAAANGDDEAISPAAVVVAPADVELAVPDWFDAFLEFGAKIITKVARHGRPTRKWWMGWSRRRRRTCVLGLACRKTG